MNKFNISFHSTQYNWLETFFLEIGWFFASTLFLIAKNSGGAFRNVNWDSYLWPMNFLVKQNFMNCSYWMNMDEDDRELMGFDKRDIIRLGFNLVILVAHWVQCTHQKYFCYFPAGFQSRTFEIHPVLVKIFNPN